MRKFSAKLLLANLKHIHRKLLNLYPKRASICNKKAIFCKDSPQMCLIQIQNKIWYKIYFKKTTLYKLNLKSAKKKDKDRPS